MINAVHTFEELAIKIDGWTVGYCENVSADMVLINDGGDIIVRKITFQPNDWAGVAMTYDVTDSPEDKSKELRMLWCLLHDEIKRRALIECRDFVRHLENARAYNEDDEHKLAKNQLI